jgi:hypothetical protein
LDTNFETQAGARLRRHDESINHDVIAQLASLYVFCASIAFETQPEHNFWSAGLSEIASSHPGDGFPTA